MLVPIMTGKRSDGGVWTLVNRSATRVVASARNKCEKRKAFHAHTPFQVTAKTEKTQGLFSRVKNFVRHLVSRQKVGA